MSQIVPSLMLCLDVGPPRASDCHITNNDGRIFKNYLSSPNRLVQTTTNKGVVEGIGLKMLFRLQTKLIDRLTSLMMCDVIISIVISFITCIMRSLRCRSFRNTLRSLLVKVLRLWIVEHYLWGYKRLFKKYSCWVFWVESYTSFSVSFKMQ